MTPGVKIFTLANIPIVPSVVKRLGNVHIQGLLSTYFNIYLITHRLVCIINWRFEYAYVLLKGF